VTLPAPPIRVRECTNRAAHHHHYVVYITQKPILDRLVMKQALDIYIRADISLSSRQIESEKARIRQEEAIHFSFPYAVSEV